MESFSGIIIRKHIMFDFLGTILGICAEYWYVIAIGTIILIFIV